MKKNNSKDKKLQLAYLDLMEREGVNIEKLINNLAYEKRLKKLQEELLKLQDWVVKEQRRVAIFFEGRDAAGKGGTIRRFIEHLNPRSFRVVALPKPTEEEQGQWYFQRYLKQLPNAGELVFFDRSWYNRAVVEPVNKFCTTKQYTLFMDQVRSLEAMLEQDGLILIKFWLDISKEEQAKRFDKRKKSPLKQWKFSPIDENAQTLWSKYSSYRDQMFVKTHSKVNPWIIIDADNKKRARLSAISYVLDKINYTDKDKKYFILDRVQQYKS